MKRIGLLLAVGIIATYLLARAEGPGGEGEGKRPPVKSDAELQAASRGCVVCHAGIEEMHPAAKLGCVDCHGGNAQATTKEEAHVQPQKEVPNDERVLPRDYDLPYQRFVNPANLRVVGETCGACHAKAIEHVTKSMHATTAGHLGDPRYENGVSKEKKASVGIMPVEDRDGEVPPYGLAKLIQIPPPHATTGNTIATHFEDVQRKQCMRCHVWAKGTGLRGRLGQDGDYRSEGCATCHVTYADDGLSKSGDPTIDKFQPGHPLKHKMTSAIPTRTCAHCHYGDAPIGLNFRGLSQLPPGAPGGPEVTGTTSARLNGVFYLKNPKVNPPDIHHEKGMHCIDCHTQSDVMGDGNIYGEMEHAVEIECQTCHGTLDAYATLTGQRGTVLSHIRREGDKFILKSKVDGKEHLVPQVKNVIDPKSLEYNSAAARAMNDKHLKKEGGLECYACHSAWSVNFFGFHFDRNPSFTQLDLISGERTPGRVNTTEKVFSTWRNFYLGWGSEGMVSPYMVGFSTVCSAYDKGGKLVLDQECPKTAAGLSGMTLVQHHLHTNRAEARSCEECHRNPAALGMGSENFRLTKEFAFCAGLRGVEVVAIDKKNVEKSLPAATLVIRGGARSVAVENDPVTAHAQYLFAACGANGVVVADVRNPVFPKEVARIATTDARDVCLVGKHLVVADGAEGLKLFDVSDPKGAKPEGSLDTEEARRVKVLGFTAYVADGPGGLAIVDLTDPANPQTMAAVKLGGEPDDAQDVVVNFEDSTPDPELDAGRTTARKIAYVAAGKGGLRIVDVMEPRKAKVVGQFDPGRRGGQGAETSVDGIAFRSVFDIGTEGGKVPSEENDYLYVTLTVQRTDANPLGAFVVLKVTDPLAPELVGRMQNQPFCTWVDVASIYQVPILAYVAFVSNPRGTITIDVTKAATPVALSRIAVSGGHGTAFEEMPLDRLLDFDGRQLKDVSHADARLFTREELVRLLSVPLETVETKSPKKRDNDDGGSDGMDGMKK